MLLGRPRFVLAGLVASVGLVPVFACGGTGTDAPLGGGTTVPSSGGGSSLGGQSGGSGSPGFGVGGKAGSTGGGIGVSGSGTGATGGSGVGGESGGSATGGKSAGGEGGSASGAGGSSGGSAGTGVGGSSGTTGNAGSGTAGNGTAGTGTGTGGGTSGCNPSGSSPTGDQDGDGWTPMDGDCNDCDANINPGAIDVMGMDQNCDGKVGPDTCDDAVAIDSKDPIDGAKAIDICQMATPVNGNPNKTTWGIIKADWENLDGSPLPSGNGDLGHGMLSAFGPNVMVQKGKRMLGISSGSARQPSDPGYQDVSGFDKGYSLGSNPLPGFPIEFAGCPGVMTGPPHDAVALRLKLKVPTNAHSFKFKLKFYTYEFPEFVCSEFNDYVVVLMDPPPPDVDPTNKNISFDSMKNPISVNNAFVDVCDPSIGAQMPGGKSFPCAAGTAELQGTGFDATDWGGPHAGTSWLVTQAPVNPGSTITLYFAAWDSGDGILDSTGLFDDFEWSADMATGTTTGKP